jgi:hypothetical protein
MARTRRKDRYIACLDSQRPSLRSFELHLAAAARDAENFVNARMVHIDAVAPRVLADSSTPAESLVSFPTSKQDPSRSPKTGKRQRDNVGGRHSWFLTDGKGVYVPSDARKAQAG